MMEFRFELTPDPMIKAFGFRLKSEGLAPKAVIRASMHKLVRFIYGVLKSQTMFTPTIVGKTLDFQDGIYPVTGTSQKVNSAFGFPA